MVLSGSRANQSRPSWAIASLTDRFQELDGFNEFHLHDPLAVAAAIESDVLTCRAASVSVVTDGEERGRTIASYGEGSVKVAVGVDVGACRWRSCGGW